MSVTITIDLGNITRPEVLAVQDFLRDFDARSLEQEASLSGETIEAAALRLGAKDAERRPIRSQLPVAVDLSAPGRVDETEAPATTQPVDPEAPKAKRGRPKKEAAQEPVDPTPAPDAEPQPGAAPTPASASATFATPAGTAPDAPSLDVLRSALQGYADRHDVDAGLALLREFGANRVSELQGIPVEKQIEFLEKANG